MSTVRLTAAQALIRFLSNQQVRRDGQVQPFFAGCFGIFGHGNVAGIGQALQQYPEFRFYQGRNEQAMVHTAAGYAKMKNRLQTFACTSSIGPGATNMVTGAAGATINRLPVLLLPGDIFARRNVAPVLQQLESPRSQDISVNDCFKPISRYWDRINRPDQLPYSLMEAMRVLTSQADTGAVTLSMPQDVQTEAFDYPAALFEERIWDIGRPRPDRELLARAVEWIRASRRPLIVAGGGVIYSEATQSLDRLAETLGIAVAETQAGKGALRFDHPFALGAVGVTGTPGANQLAREADLVVGVGTRYSDFTTASKTAFKNPGVRFLNINVTEFDAHKHAALPLVGDARVVLDELLEGLKDFRTEEDYRRKIANYQQQWRAETERLFHLEHGPPLAQSEVIGAVNRASQAQDVVVCAAGSLPGDLHKLWPTRDPKGYHLEYGYSCMGYEIAGGLGVKMAAPDREVYVMVGDGSYLMMSSEIVTSIQEGHKLIIVLLDNHGHSSIGGLSQSVGSGGFGTSYRFRNPETGALDGAVLPIDFAANARGLGAIVLAAEGLEELANALEEAKGTDRTTVVVVETDPEERVPGYESWWDVPIPEVASMDEVEMRRRGYEAAVKEERTHL